MAILQKREMEIPLNGGMDTTSSEELQSTDTLRLVSNLRFSSDGEYEKLPAINVEASGTIPTGSPYGSPLLSSGIYTRGEEVFTVTRDHGIGRAPGRSNAMRFCRRDVDAGSSQDSALRYAVVPCSVERRFLDRVQTTKDQATIGTFASAVYNSETLVVAWTSWNVATTATYLHVVAYDLATWSIWLEEQTVSLGNSQAFASVNCLELLESSKQGVLITVGILGAPCTIAAYRWDNASNDVLFDSNLTTNAETTQHTIAASASNRFYLGFTDNTSVFLKVQDRSTTAITSTHTGTHAAYGIAIVKGASNTLIASSRGALLYAEVLGTPGSVVTLRNLAGNNFDTCNAAIEARSDYTHACVVYGGASYSTLPGTALPVNTVGPKLTSYHFVTFNTTTPVDQQNGYIPHGYCIGAATVNGRAHGIFAPNYDRISGVFDVEFQYQNGSLVVARASMPVIGAPARHDVVARIVHERFAQGSSSVVVSAGAAAVVGQKLYFACAGDIVANQLAGGYVQSLFLSTVDFTPRPMPWIDLGDGTTLLSGGTLHLYDGTTASEAQPIDRPTVYVDGSVAGASTGTFGFSAVYSFVDAAGNIHRSAPSDIVVITVAAKRLDAYVSALPFTAYDGVTLQLYEVALYVTAAGGSVLYKIGTKYGSLSTNGMFYVWNGGAASNEAIYSTSGSGSERASTPPPAFASIWRSGDIIWALDAEDTTRVWHSKPLVTGYSAEWSNLNNLLVGDHGVCGADVGGVPTVFGKRGIHQIYGEGPNALGVGSYAVPRRLPVEIETVSKTGICKANGGVFFRTRQGVYLIDPGLTVRPVSGQLDNDLALTGQITGYCKLSYDETNDELHLIDFDAKHWLFSVSEGKWGSWGQAAYGETDIVSVSGKTYLVRSSDPGIWRYLNRDETSYNTSVGAWLIVTPWIRFDGVTGRMRVYDVILQVRVGTPIADSGDITVTYDTRDGDTEQWVWTAADLAQLSSDNGIVTLRGRVTHQRTSRFRLTIADTPGGTPTNGSVPVGLRIIYGVTPGGDVKQKAAQTKGSV